MSDEVFQEESSLTCTPLNASQDNMALVCKVCNTYRNTLTLQKFVFLEVRMDFKNIHILQ